MRRGLHLSIRRDQREKYRSQMQWHTFNPRICRQIAVSSMSAWSYPADLASKNKTSLFKPVSFPITSVVNCNKVSLMTAQAIHLGGQKSKMGLLKFLTTVHTQQQVKNPWPVFLSHLSPSSCLRSQVTVLGHSGI